MIVWSEQDRITAEYYKRSSFREVTLMKATMEFVLYFISLGDSKEVADDKVSQISTEVAALLYVYTLGNVQPLFNGINASTLPFMTAEAKAKLIGDLTPTV